MQSKVILDEVKEGVEEANTTKLWKIEPFQQAMNDVSPTETKATPEQYR